MTCIPRSNRMRRSSPFLRTCLLVLGSLLFSVVAQAQYRGSIQGVVTDSQGALVPGAKVTLTDKATGRTQETTSNDSGLYTFGALAPTRYSLSVEKAGFKKKVLD